MAPNNIQSPQPSVHGNNGAKAVGAIILWILVASLLLNCVLCSLSVALLARMPK